MVEEVMEFNWKYSSDLEWATSSTKRAQMNNTDSESYSKQ